MSEPATVIAPGGTAAVVRILAGADEAFTIRQLARMAEVSPHRAHQVIERLSDHGLVDTEFKGASRLCRLNHDHLAASAVVQIAHLRSALLGLLRSTIRGWRPRVVHASLFGSAARGDGTTSSDLDILVVRPAEVNEGDPAWIDQQTESGDAIYRATGNRVAWFSLTRTELEASVGRDEAIVDEWRRDAIQLAGVSLRSLIGRAA